MKIRHILTQIKNFFDTEKRQRDADYKYLSEAVDTGELENRGTRI
jgi:hypothetical protein